LEDGLSFESGNKKFKGKLGGRIDLDVAAFSEDSEVRTVPGIGDIPAGTEFRRARLSLQGEYRSSLPAFYKVEVDFGVAKVINHDESSITATGAVMGTPSYMSPEQAAELAAYAGLDWLNLPGRTNTLVFGVYTYRTPAKMLTTFAPILVTLGNKLATSIHQGVQIEMLIFRSYESALTALEDGRLNFMRMGPSSYVQIKARSPTVDLLVSQKHAEPLTVAIFTRTNSGINGLADLLGKSFAFGDTNSTTGNYVAKRLLRSQGLHGADFVRYDYLETHADVMDAVDQGEFDAGAVNLDLVKKRPQFKTIGTNSLTNLGLCWVAGPSLAAPFKNKLPHCFLLMNNSSVLTNLESKVTGFMRLDDSAFDELREMMKEADNFSE
jgi:ABC-type phosphate/phosphonate transport system substrate-binding protein